MAALINLVYDLPYLAIAIAGIAYAAIHWSRHPRMSLLLVCFLGLSVVRMIFFELALPLVHQIFGGPYLQIYGNPFLRFSWVILGAVGYGGLVWAAFVGYTEGAAAARVQEATPLQRTNA